MHPLAHIFLAGRAPLVESSIKSTNFPPILFTTISPLYVQGIVLIVWSETLSERRFLSGLEACTTYLGRPGLASGMRDLFGINDSFQRSLGIQHGADENRFYALAEKFIAHPYSLARFRYYQQAISFYHWNGRMKPCGLY